MSEIRINYAEVYAKTAALQRIAQAELREANAAYRKATSDLRGMDGSTNAQIIAAVETIQHKAQATTNTLTKLLAFIDLSARQVERSEVSIARAFQASNIRTERATRIGGRN